MTKTIDALVEALEPVATWMEQSANCSSGGPDHPPEPTSQFDYELLQAASEIRAALAQARAEEAEPVAWLVYAGILDMRPAYPAYNTKELAESAAACIKSNTEVRPLYLAPPAAPVAKLEPLRGEEIYEIAKQVAPKTLGMYDVPHWVIPFADALTAAHNAKL